MKHLKLFSLTLAAIGLLGLSACSNSDTAKTQKDEKVTFTALNGEVKVPAHPERIAVQNYPDDVATLGANVIGTDSWAYPNPYLSDKQKENMADLGTPSFNLEKLIAQKPDLIVTVDKSQVSDYEKIAPTVLVNYQDLNNMDKSLDFFAKLLNREDEKKEFIEAFDKKADEQKAKLKEQGVNTSKSTISLLELQADKIYAYGSNFARGGQALTRGLGFQESAKMAELSKGIGYSEVNAESLKDFDADYIFIDFKNADKAQYEALQKNPVWKNLKAVKEGHVITMDYDKVYFFGGPTASMTQLTDYTDALISQTK
ncbi:iron-hydroxamate ABC transporter substrate-binding protein [Lactococcus garvieae]|jgi:iron complex transport system substrate-binding protein|uniref:Ferrichrome-binding periplasmic protein n=1 Tax=Lactococcus garvieae DCC43 TaxID=1231377 RepID=K2PJZ8_9LACT|nr:iron-hydroxamate ABC transporter substrate-binding protein [Lactococcus garvieae]EKF51690.1 Ferrichrome-binding periplasmic protein precursor [Lactococcus garvieae DCC43]